MPPGTDDEFGDAHMEGAQPRRPNAQPGGQFPQWNPYMFQGWQPPFMQPAFVQPPFMQPPFVQPPYVQRRAREVKIAPFWKGDPVAWFKTLELRFRRWEVEDSHHRFELLLPNLQEDLVEQLRSILRTADSMEDPYTALKTELLQQFAPNIQQQLNGILYGPELGGQPPSMLMRGMLNLLLDGEPAGLLFRHIFVQRLPADLRDQVAARLNTMEAAELAGFADSLWHMRNSRKGQGRPVMAVQEPAEMVSADNELQETVAAMSLSKKKKGPPKKGRSTRGSRVE